MGISLPDLKYGFIIILLYNFCIQIPVEKVYRLVDLYLLQYFCCAFSYSSLVNRLETITIFFVIVFVLFLRLKGLGGSKSTDICLKLKVKLSYFK